MHFPSLSIRARLQSRFLPVAFWETISRGSIKNIFFLIPYSQDLATYLKRGHALSISLDGPYGEQFDLGRYKLVILMVNGEGIAGILSLTLSILSRRKWDEKDKAQGLRSKLYYNKTRKIDLVWRLQDNAQIEWASSYFTHLSGIKVIASEERRKMARVSITNSRACLLLFLTSF